MTGIKNDKNERFSSWKEIAAYLGCDKRTCQRWEKKFGLPVQRMEKSPRARVFAQKEDLDYWREGIIKNSKFLKEFQKPAQAKISSRNLNKRYVFLVILAASIIAFIIIFPKIFFDHQLTDFRIENSNLVILNAAGKEIWRHDTKLENLEGTEFYKNSFQYKRELWNESRPPHIRLPLLIVRDLDQDGFKEVLFALITADESQGGKVILFNHKGSVSWEHQTGKKILCGQRVFPSDFAIVGLDTRDLDNDGRQEIIIISHAKNEFPTRVQILRTNDEIVGEYWNAGIFDDIEYIDANKDGYEEIFLSGQNNEYEKPCLAVLNPRLIRGGSPQSPAFAFEGLEVGKELFYILFPLTDVDQFYRPGNALYRTERLSDQVIRVWTNTSLIIFEFSFNLRLQSVSLSHTYKLKRDEFFMNGKIKDKLVDEKMIFYLAQSVLYYDGKTNAWVNHPAMSNAW